MERVWSNQADTFQSFSKLHFVYPTQVDQEVIYTNVGNIRRKSPEVTLTYYNYTFVFEYEQTLTFFFLKNDTTVKCSVSTPFVCSVVTIKKQEGKY